MAAPLARYLRRLTAHAAMDCRGPAIPRRHQLLVDSGRVLMLLGAVVLTNNLATTAPAAGNTELMLLAFVLWLLGAGLAMLSLVARQFPRLAGAGAATATGLRNYLLGGL